MQPETAKSVAEPIDLDAALAQRLFAHEQILVGNLRRLPLIVRYGLDQIGIALPLLAWQALSYAERRAIALAPTDTPLARQSLRARVLGVLQQSGADAAHLQPEPMEEFRDRQRMPPSLTRELAERDVHITLAQWGALPELARYGLTKLSRPGHANERFYALLVDLFGSPLPRATETPLSDTAPESSFSGRRSSADH